MVANPHARLVWFNACSLLSGCAKVTSNKLLAFNDSSVREDCGLSWAQVVSPSTYRVFSLAVRLRFFQCIWNTVWLVALPGV